MSHQNLQLRWSECVEEMSELKLFFENARSDELVKAKVEYNSLVKLEEEFKKLRLEILDYNSSSKGKTLAIDTNDEYQQLKKDFKGCESMFYKLELDAKENGSLKEKKFQGLKMPEIKITPFSGDLTKFPEFISLYDGLIHFNSELNLEQKFYFLKTLLLSEAKNVVNHLLIDSSTYQLAYDTLVQHYQSQRRQASFYINEILNFKNNKKCSLKDFLILHRNSFRALENLKINNLGEFIIFHLSYLNLDNHHKKLFDLEINSSKIPDINQFFEFLQKHSRAEELRKDCEVENKTKEHETKARFHARSNSFLSQARDKGNAISKTTTTTTNNTNSNSKSNANEKVCLYCSLNYNQQSFHRLEDCKLFQHLLPRERVEFAKQHKLCFRCLENHLFRLCTKKSLCLKCEKPHSTVLHYEAYANKNLEEPQSRATVTNTYTNPGVTKTHVVTENNATQESTKSTNSNIFLSSATKANKDQENYCLLGTIEAYCTDSYGTRHKLKCLLDQGSQSCLITKNTLERLSLPISKSKHDYICGVSGAESKILGTTELTIFPNNSIKPKIPLNLRAIVINQISSSNVPHKFVPRTNLFKLSKLRLADPEYDQPADIDLLLSVDIFNEIVNTEGSVFEKGYPSLLHTKFGVILQGKIYPPADESDEINCHKIEVYHTNTNIELQRLWEIQEGFVNEVSDHEVCEEHFVKNTKRDSDGRFVVKYPFKEDPPNLGSNREMAVRNFLRLEKKTAKDSKISNLYHEYMRSLFLDGYLEETANNQYILPQNIVLKENSSTPLRVVWNGSSKSDRQTSLNSEMYVGTNLLKNITEVLTNFRFNKICLLADIRRCYLEIKMSECSQMHQVLLYRKNSTDELKEFKINRLIFGAAASPWLCMRSLKQLSIEHGHEYPKAAEALQETLYLDNIATGGNSVEEVVELREQLTKLLKEAKFELRKFMSNEKQVLEDLEEEKLEKTIKIGDNEVVKVLGLCYDVKSDCFLYTIQPFSGVCTKRSILSYLSKIFDPLNFLAPVTLLGRYLLQMCHQSKLDWDDKVPTQIEKDWLSYVNSLSYLSTLQIPRWIPSKFCEFSIIATSDASQIGQAANVYLHCDFGSHCSSTLLMAKTRLNPLSHELTIPKKELSAMLLSSQLVQSVMKSIKLDIGKVIMFTDSQICLYWLEKDVKTLEVFVAHRVTKINAITDKFEWRYINTKYNPSDQSSRGMNGKQFTTNNSIWWHGPDFFQTKICEFPDFISFKIEDFPTLIGKEVKSPGKEFGQVKIHSTLVTAKEVTPEWFEGFSSYNKLLRITARVYRFIKNCREKDKTKRVLEKGLTTLELLRAEKTLVRLSQNNAYKEDILIIKRNKNNFKKCLKPLQPYLDEDNLLRVGGRISNSDLSHNAKHPYILSSYCWLASLLVKHYHEKYLHIGTTYTKVILRQKFWVIGCHTLIRRIIRSCKRCARFSRFTNQPKMGDLPEERVQPVSRAFTNTGLDFAGPIYIKSSSLRKAPMLKSYFVVFVCLNTRGIHLELCSDLTMKCFMASLQRFVSRRGLPKLLWSDNGSNFVAAKKQLTEVSSFLLNNQQEIEVNLQSLSISWKLNPPYGSHFGGSWEVQVKLVKNLLYKNVLTTILTYEEMYTILCRIEAMVNSRPLCKIAEDSDVSYLAPSLFLMGDYLHSIPEDVPDPKMSLKCRWSLLKQITHNLWKRWKSEYVNSLISANKWFTNCKNICVGDLVYVKEMNTSPLNYPIGRVVKVFPGKDNIVRVVEVFFNNKSFVRPVNKLILIGDSE